MKDSVSQFLTDDDKISGSLLQQTRETHSYLDTEPYQITT